MRRVKHKQTWVADGWGGGYSHLILFNFSRNHHARMIAGCVYTGLTWTSTQRLSIPVIMFVHRRLIVRSQRCPAQATAAKQRARAIQTLPLPSRTPPVHLTETLHPAEPRGNSRLFTESNQAELDGLVKRRAFKLAKHRCLATPTL